MKKPVLILIAILILPAIFSQQPDTLRIENCLKIAYERSPLGRQKSNSTESFAYKVKNLNTRWYPSVDFSAQAIYNSETVHFADLMEGSSISIPSLPLDQYKIWADINQQLYDGGMVKAQKAVEKAGYETDIQQTESELLGMKQQVSQVYFSILLTQKNSTVLQVTLEELTERRKILQAGVDYGAVLPEEMLAMEAEEIRLQQRITDLKYTKEYLLKALSVLMDSTIAENMIIAEPADPGVANEAINRPEHILFDKQKERLLASQKLVTASVLPKLFAFSQAAYGRPGYNFLSRDFHTFYAVGLGMKWNFLNYGNNKRQKKILDIQKDMVNIKCETFDDQLNIQLQSESTNLIKYDELLKQDEHVVELRKAIAATSLSKMVAGVITSTDYLSDLNAEIFATLQFENHKILKLQAAYNYRLLQGNM
jgi:outer membrane protein TolC